MATIVCTREGGMDLGNGVVLAHGPNEVDDDVWSQWAEKYAVSHFLTDGILYRSEQATPIEPEQPTELFE